MPRWAKWIFVLIELPLLLPCVGLSALYLPTPDPAAVPAYISPLPYTKHVVIVGPKFSTKTPCPPPLFILTLGMLFIYGYNSPAAWQTPTRHQRQARSSLENCNTSWIELFSYFLITASLKYYWRHKRTFWNFKFTWPNLSVFCQL